MASKDPVVAITCLCMRADVLSTGEAAAAPAAPVVPAAAADLAPIGGEGEEEDEEGGGGGLGDLAAAGGSPILGADEGFDPGQNPSKDPDRAGGGGVEAVVFTWAAGGAPGALRPAAVGGGDVRRFPDEAAMLAAWQSWLMRMDPDVLAIFQVRGLHTSFDALERAWAGACGDWMTAVLMCVNAKYGMLAACGKHGSCMSAWRCWPAFRWDLLQIISMHIAGHCWRSGHEVGSASS